MTEYDCAICNEPEHSDSQWEPKLAICTDCWFDYLTGSERKAIATRVKA